MALYMVARILRLVFALFATSSVSCSRPSRDAEGGSTQGSKYSTHSWTGTSCANRDISECTELLEVLTKKDIGFAANQQELNDTCPVLMDGLRCIDNYTLYCLNPQHRTYFNELYAGTIQVIEDLCNIRGTYQKEYIRHAPCMRKVHPEYNKCSEVYHAKTARLNEVNSAVVKLSESDRRRNVITLCCSFQEYLRCSERIVFETCGNHTATFTKEFLNRMAGPIVDTKCTKYEPGSPICIYGLSGSSRVVSINVGLFLGLLVSLAAWVGL